MNILLNEDQILLIKDDISSIRNYFALIKNEDPSN